MTKSIYHEAKLVQLESGAEWYVAIPHPSQAGVLAVDVGKNLSFATCCVPENTAGLKPVPAFNRFVPLQVALIPSMLEASPFNLLANLLYGAVADVDLKKLSPRQRLVVNTLQMVVEMLGQGLHSALTSERARPETLYVEHDFLAQQVMFSLRQAGFSQFRQEDGWPDG